jgi:HAD superfamily hydrolase (TIGR01549 family)
MRSGRKLPKLIVGNKRIDCKLVVFDKDGTLVDSRKVLLELARARRKSVEKIGGKDDADLWERIVGVDLKSGEIDYHGPLGTAPRHDEMLIASAAFYMNGRSWDEAKQLAQKAYDDADESMRPPYGSVLLEGVADALMNLKNSGLILAVASTDTHKRIVESFKTLGIAGVFTVIVGPEDVANGKPAPDMILEILKKTGCDADETIVVGDSISDMKMGRNARIKACIGVLTGITSRVQLRKHADSVIASVAQLKAH